MPTVTRPDGADIHYELRGEGEELVALASYWSWAPGIYDEVLDDLASDHRVLVYHLRGTGGSTHRGPYDMETDIADLEALLEQAGPPATLIGTADGANRAVKLAARRPDLVGNVVTLGAGPLSRKGLSSDEGMLSSDAVINAFIEMLDNDYRAGLRTITTATNEQMNEEELRVRVEQQAGHAPREPAVARVRAWVEDEPDAEARTLGKRLSVITAENAAGPWLPSFDELLRALRERLPEARIEVFSEGLISRPAEGAALIREIIATVGSPS